ncbi:hypothetical protein BCV39_04805 [Vibrio sp. 10N.286.55.E10]|nr:hypothetical protein BCV40_17235 [Vibrio sp. 10N.286.55.E12]PME34086.1 hypothetical protein BCV39_04805 [Vibrio sp. 10N.286.55.E10]PME63619.1 hypothetical protein BCV32_02190 [Vibrio sp. 10N.286.55.C11]PMI18794.1 hypothetical protein BCU50_21080 [Vibrio sp. 10N.286.46.E10]PMI97442.1 hypothetical protein BCU34_18065 [Vibrio sp. 10N.286.45.E10]PTO92668.1 hypothetical protein CWO08_18245 [Vibrio sp. 10N.286.48.B8]PTP02289.1 hypothetical protein CWO17_14820 [Vibrio sp. 10N.286.45.A3]CAK390965
MIAAKALLDSKQKKTFYDDITSDATYSKCSEIAWEKAREQGGRKRETQRKMLAPCPLRGYLYQSQ